MSFLTCNRSAGTFLRFHLVVDAQGLCRKMFARALREIAPRAVMIALPQGTAIPRKASRKNAAAGFANQRRHSYLRKARYRRSSARDVRTASDAMASCNRRVTSTVHRGIRPIAAGRLARDTHSLVALESGLAAFDVVSFRSRR